MRKSKRIENKSSRTAAYTCVCRASSYLEPETIYKSDDYVAVRLLPVLVKYLLTFKILNLRGRISPKGIYPYVIARTKYLDNIFRHAVENSFGQVVIYGAGFDSRAVRFLNPDSDIRVFEIDTALTLDAKAKQFNKRKVTKPEDNIYIPVDFNKEKIRPKLLSSQFNIHKKSLSVLEGIIMYLSHDAVDETFRLISDYSAPGSLLVFDYIYSSVLRRENKYFGESSIYNRVMKDNEEWTFGIEEGEIENFLNRYRFNLMEHLDSNIIENKYFRNDSGQVITKVNGTHCIVLASKPD